MRWCLAMAVVLSAGVPAPSLYGEVEPAGSFRKTAIPKSGSFTVSIEVDRLFSRDVDDASVSGIEYDDTFSPVGSLDPDTTTHKVELKSSALLARLGYALFSAEDQPFGLEGYATIGVADLSINGRVTAPGVGQQLFNAEGDWGIAFGGGMRAQVYRHDRLRVFVDGSMRLSFHDATVAQVDVLGLTVDPGSSATQDFESRLFSWQVSAFVSYAFEPGGVAILPYGGISLSGVNVHLDGTQRFFDGTGDFDGAQDLDWDTTQRDVFGLIAGVEVGLGDRFGLFAEIRFVNEFAVVAGGSISF